MPIQFGGTPIGGMQYNGVTIGEAMMDGQIVYRSSPYPLTGTFNIVNGAAFVGQILFSHTVVEPGSFTGTVTPTSGETTTYLWYVNGASPPGAQGLTYTFNGLSVGDTIKVEALHIATMNLSGTWSLVKIPVVTITGTSGYTSRDQFRAACTQYGVNYQTVQKLPFRLDTSQATNLSYLFDGCSSLTKVPDLDTSQVTNLNYTFYNCSALTNGNVLLIGKHPSVTTAGMILNSGLTREPFQGAEGTITGRTLTNNTLTTLATHAITAASGGNGKLTLARMTLAWGNATATKSIRIDLNGVQVATATGQNPVATVEGACNIGDVIAYRATVNSTTTSNRVISSGTWGAWIR